MVSGETNESITVPSQYGQSHSEELRGKSVPVSQPANSDTHPRLLFTHVHFADLLSSYPLGHSFKSPTDEGTALSGVGKILAIEYLELPVLLDKSVDDDSIVVERGPGDGREHGCDLCRC